MRAVTSKTLGPTFGMYSHGMIAPGGELVVVAGQVAADRAGKLVGPGDVVARFFHAGSLLREHRGDGHIAALMIEGVGGLEAHVLFALDMGMPAEKFGRIHHLPAAQLAAVIDGMRDRGLIGHDGWLSEPGCAVKQRVEALTDDLAAKPYESLEPDELDELVATLEPLAALLLAAQD